MFRHHTVAALVVVVVVALASAQPIEAASCERLAAIRLPHATVTLATLVDAGSFVQFPAGRAGAGGGSLAAGGGGRGAVAASPFADLPAFCRVTATLMPSNVPRSRWSCGCRWLRGTASCAARARWAGRRRSRQVAWRFTGALPVMPVRSLQPGPLVNRRLPEEGYGAVQAFDPTTGARKWEFKMADVTDSGILTTASDLLFSGGREGYFLALDGGPERCSGMRGPERCSGRRASVARSRPGR
jgi:hypothetical protein